MSRVVIDDHFKRMPRDTVAAVIWPKYCRYGIKHYIINQSITVGVACYRTLTAHDQWPWVPGIDIYLQSLAGNGVFRMSEKILEWDHKPTNKQMLNGDIFI